MYINVAPVNIYISTMERIILLGFCKNFLKEFAKKILIYIQLNNNTYYENNIS